MRWRKRGDLHRLIADGDAANRQRRWDIAAIAYAEALAIDPRLTAIWVQYGHALKEQGQRKEAEAAYRRAIALSPHDADAHLQLGHVRKLIHGVAAAMPAYRAALRADPRNAHALRELDEGLPSPRMPPDDRAAVHRLLAGHDVPGRLLAMFDRDDYLYGNGLAELEGGSLATVLEHFLKPGGGVDRMLPAHRRLGFDPDAYRAMTPMAATLDPVAAYRHWLSVGLDAGGSPNLTHFFARVTGIEDIDDVIVSRLLDRDRAALLAAPDDAADRLATLLRPSSVDRLIDGVARTADGRTAALFGSIADRWFVDGDHGAADLLRRALIETVPDAHSARQHIADALLGRAMPAFAAIHYSRIVDGPAATPWTYRNLARCRRETGDAGAAYAVLRDAVTRFPIDRALAAARDRAGDDAFAACWAYALAADGETAVTEAQHGLHAICEAISPIARHAPPARVAPIRTIALIANQSLEQCRLYRVEQKTEQLRAAGFTVDLFDADSDVDAFAPALDRFDAAIFYRVAGFPAMLRAIAAANAAGLDTFYEIDDLIFDADAYPPPLDSFGGLVSRAEHVGLAAGVPLFAAAMARCDFGIASTPALAEAMRRHVRSGRVAVHRNAIGARHLRAIGAAATPRRADRPVTIFYGSGTRAHSRDFADLVEPALLAAARRQGSRIRIILAGHSGATPALDAAGAVVQQIDAIQDAEAYWSLLSRADINLAMLAPSLATDCKSEIKWLEAAMLGIPSIVSRTRTYDAVVEDGVTALLCDSAADWAVTIERLVVDAPLRARIGDAARRRALTDYAPGRMADNIAGVMAAARANRPRRPRILIVNVFYPPQAIGGATRVVHDTIDDLVARHGDVADIEVFTTIDGEAEGYRVRRYVENGIRVTGVTTPDRPDIEARDRDRRMGDIFGRELDRGGFDLVHFHCIQRLTVDIVEAAIARDLPYLITAHDGWWISDRQFLADDEGRISLYDYAIDPAARWDALGPEAAARMAAREPALRGAHAVLTVSEPFAALHRKAGIDRLRVISNGIGAGLVRRRVRDADPRIRIALIGGASPHKGYVLLRRALLANRFANLRATIIDHAMPPGTYRHEIWGATEIAFMPRVEQDRVADLYHRTDVLLAPSIWPESFGLVAREAIASGCWVVASDRGAIGADVTPGINGFVVDVADHRALAAALATIDADPERFGAMPPPPATPLRTVADQVDELVGLYRETLRIGQAAVAAIAIGRAA